MRFTLLVLATVGVAVAQDTVSATAGVCEPHDDHW